MKRYTTILLWAAALAGCAKEAPDAPATGYGTLALTAGCASEIVAQTRAERIELPAEEIPARSDLGLLVESADPEYEFTQCWESVADYDSQNDSLWATKYTLTLFTGEKPGAEASPEGIGCPYFEGSATKLVSVGLEATRVDITARLANTAVRIGFTERFKGYFGNGARFSLTTEAGNSFETGYAPGEAEADAVYYYVRPGRFTISGEATKQTPSAAQPAQTVKFADTVQEAAAAGTLYTYTFDVSGVGPTEQVVITVNDRPIRTETIDEELNDDAIPNDTEN